MYNKTKYLSARELGVFICVNIFRTLWLILAQIRAMCAKQPAESKQLVA
jgi:hypothetical protein